MAIPSIPRLAVLTLGLALAAAASAADEAQLVEAINAYRGQVQSCGGQASGELPPLAADPRLALPVNAAGDLQQAMAQAAYPMVNVQSISLSGPRDAGAAMKALQESFCRVVLDPQFVDVGVSRQDRDWRIVLARPLLRG
ncbi:TPA: CAP domain-containing protein, partial [Pseudomonas aeruginosa]|nr:CAP domain-containing protein [Pseudomonas aeruginosa]